MVKKGLFILVFLLLLSSVLAQSPSERGTNWLVKNADWSKDTESLAFTILALERAGKLDKAQEGLQKLLERQDASGCFPKEACKVKDTALATIVLRTFGKDTSRAKNWLEEQKRTALAQGTWWLQLVTSGNGKCDISYDSKTKTFTIENEKVLECSSQPWVDINNCIEQDLTTKNLTQELNVRCNANSIVSLIYQITNNYYILQEEHSSKATIKISNAYFGDYEQTAFATWALNKLEKDTSTLAYLESNIPPEDPLYRALLLLITGKKQYANWLESQQELQGNLGDVYTTSFAILALKSSRRVSQNATQWLEFEQEQDGSWNSNMLDTAIALYSIFEERKVAEGEAEERCGDGVCNIGESEINCPTDCERKEFICGNSIIEGFEECDSKSDDACPGLCNIPGSVDACKCRTLEKQEICTDAFDNDNDRLIDCNDPDCDLDEVCAPIETNCKDEEDNDNDGLIDCDDSDCKEAKDCQGGFPWFLVVALLFIIFALAAAFAIYKKTRPKETKEEFPFKPYVPKKEKGREKPILPRIPSKETKSKVDIELEKSLEEAEKLLKKEK